MKSPGTGDQSQDTGTAVTCTPGQRDSTDCKCAHITTNPAASTLPVLSHMHVHKLMPGAE